MDIEIKNKRTLLKKYVWGITGSIVVIATVIWAVSATGTHTLRADTRGVLVSDAVQGEFDDCIRISGRVESGTIVQVSALESGIVDHKWVEEGENVSAGDVIITLNNPTLRQQILDSESQLAEKQNMLRDTEIAMEKDRLQMKQELLTARTDLNRKERLARQQETLYKEDLTSREEYLTANENYQLAKESVSLLENRLHQDSLYRGVQLAMMRESLDNMRENFMLVRRRADNLNIRATHSGQLGSLNAELGQNIPYGQQVGQINILDKYKLSVEIDEHYIDRLSLGLHGEASRGNQKLEVTVSKIYPEVNRGKFKVDLAIADNDNSNLRVGQNYPVELTIGEPTQTVMIERGSFFQNSGGRWVYVLDPDGKSATRREIKIGRQNPRYYEVLEGIQPGERVIVSSYAPYGEADRIYFNNRL